MNKPDTLDKQALESAKHYMGGVAWPTVYLALGVATGYLATLALSLAGVLALWLAAPLVVLFTYLAYTVLHEAVHGSISGSNRSLRWLNEALGYAAAWILMIPLTVHRHEHLAHHRHTNDPENDPDYHVAGFRDSPIEAPISVAKLFYAQFEYYMTQRWSKAPAKQNLYFCLEMLAILAPRLALLAMGYWLEVLVLFVAAWLVGVALLLYLFAYIVHRPHEDMGRYVDTSTIIAPAPWHSVVTWLWMFQNYHAIHHLFPRVPFYQYVKLCAEIEPIMLARGAPVYELTLRGLVARDEGRAALA